MEGPTPVSALLHAATMILAGVVLIIRSSQLFELAPNILVILVFVGLLTSFSGGLFSCMLLDVKKIIAYSTCSQLGFMFLSCGLSNYNLALFHMCTHAFFKALLFLCAGIIIQKL